jgi:hypothetical protein
MSWMKILFLSTQRAKYQQHAHDGEVGQCCQSHEHSSAGYHSSLCLSRGLREERREAGAARIRKVGNRTQRKLSRACHPLLVAHKLP